jgi:osmotically-inducible protein OsmY
VTDRISRDLAADTAAGLPGIIRVDNRLGTQVGPTADRSDERIARMVASVLKLHRRLGGGTRILVVRGTVTLHGIAASREQRQRIMDVASDIVGTVLVVDAMTIDPQQKPDDLDRIGPVDDASVAALVRTAMRARRSTAGALVGIEASGGMVTLSGSARSEAERALVSRVAHGIHGVTGIRNLMSIDPVR